MGYSSGSVTVECAEQWSQGGALDVSDCTDRQAWKRASALLRDICSCSYHSRGGPSSIICEKCLYFPTSSRSTEIVLPEVLPAVVSLCLSNTQAAQTRG